MYLNTTVKIPVEKGKVITKKKGGATYILYQYGVSTQPCVPVNDTPFLR